MDNIFIRTNPEGNIKTDKEKSTEKIDRVIAMIKGFDRAIRNGVGENNSVYDERGSSLFSFLFRKLLQEEINCIKGRTIKSVNATEAKGAISSSMKKSSTSIYENSNSQ